jgi:hypothetical protein
VCGHGDSNVIGGDVVAAMPRNATVTIVKVLAGAIASVHITMLILKVLRMGNAVKQIGMLAGTSLLFPFYSEVAGDRIMIRYI